MNSKQPGSGRLEGKVAIVTGGGSGFGAGVARKFVDEGARVLATALHSLPALQVLALDACH